MGRESDWDREDKNKISRDKVDRTEADRDEEEKKYGIRAGLCAFLLLFLWMIARDRKSVV